MPILTNQGSRFLRRAAATSADWWTIAGQTCVAAYKPIGAGSLATSYVNLANPGVYNAAPGIAPTLAAGGWTFNGTAQYLTTGIAAVASYTVLARFSGWSNYTIFGTSRGGSGYHVLPSLGGYTYYRNFSERFVAGGHVAGVIGLAGKQPYFDGATDGAALGAGDVTADAIFIGALNNGTGASEYGAGTIAAVAIYSTALSAVDVAALTARMAALA